MAIQEVLVSKIFNYTSEPTKKVEGQFWFNPSTNVLSRYNGTAWKPISVSSDDVVVLSNGNKVSLTNYLNTQIAALAEGIDTKQDKLTYYSENTEAFQSNISAPYVGITANEYVNIKGQSAIELTTDTSTSHILLSAGDQSIKLDDGNFSHYITINGNLTGTAIKTKIGSYDMSSNTSVPSEHAVAEALLGKQDKLSTYKETVHSSTNTNGDKIVITATPYDVTNPGSITLSAINEPEYPGVINLKADDIQFNDKSFATIQSEIDENIAATKPKFYSEVNLDSSHPDSNGNYGKYATINTSADSGGDSIVNINTQSLYEGISKINLHTDNTYNNSVISLFAHSGQAGGGGNSTVSIAAVNDEYDTTTPSQIIKSYNSNIDVDCKSIILSSNTLSIKLDGYSQPTSVSTATSGIYINGELYGSSISTSIPTSDAVDTKVTSEKAVKTELDKKQDKLITYSENAETGDMRIDGNSIQLNSSNISLNGGLQGEAIVTSLATIDLASDIKIPTEKAVATELDKKQDKLAFYNEDTSTNQKASIQGANSFSIQNTNKGLIIDGNDGGITISNNNFNAGQGVISITGNNWKNNSDQILFDIGGDGIIKISDALLIPEIKNKQNSTDNTLETSAKTIVGAINEINSIFNVNALPTPITDVKTITTSLETLITDTQYANKPGTILINPNIKNTGAILVGEAITDISKAFPIYTDQPVTIAFKNINDFKVAGENAGESFNYIISFGYINQSISTNA